MKNGYSYRGFEYDRYEDVEPEENIKIYHFANSVGGVVKVVNENRAYASVTLDWSPYEELTEEQFRLFVDNNFPSRFTVREFGGPLSEEELHQINQARIDEEVRQHLIEGLS